MKVVAIIPARYASSRLKGKALLTIADKSMIQHVYERAKKASLVNNVIVATDDKKIFDAVEGFAGKAAMTSIQHRTGTDRIAEVAAKMDADIIINVQGDEPLIEPEMIDEAIRPLLQSSDILMSTLKKKITDEDELINPNIVKVVTDKEGFAIYFSRFPIPYVRAGSQKLVVSEANPSEVRSQKKDIHYKHIGLYVYRKDFLLKFAKMKPTPLEEAEKLEQLRALENGYKIKVIETQYSSIGVDTQEDLERVRRIVSSK
ncbi:MAG: 3-deoxy-manno-octulosonate cytidylyltransferase [Deltaproteobacteria bacterium GWC2_42_51]|nr:MAG: 3-deoxy-manno-octulosonate cytidylyltransferase [Deltaproteobacteria bacterium GWB2_42_7]OGP37433.1 MAG: 3-deoxy-manno-octulosonate cytidylyltransferase [Deltaproteobacteria bacterium GWC2_42_51]OGP40123.1 MAG: 3-deoxy-manno-octulosonate cytidylyltransferase [Deltaproteobacteria bacterium GWD2_42_10]OGP47527.1 MAG: 3-deoxy-manno-octulosonate cytidylyltransferase [Deltaproteobacteria bacterium GWF2_42_12]OGQ26157.1 MAG: 3-deoxy-manno-octulosonate cytidylyltransferase [Deltaproteobacteria